MGARIKPRVVIVDYQLANMFSVERACAHVGLDPVVTSDPGVIEDSDAVILPGVGAFGEAMANLRRLGLVSPLIDVIDSGKPFLGICLGMQLLFSESEEFGVHQGLDIIPGKVVRFPSESRAGRPIRVPQIGWNRICAPTESSWEGTLLAGTPSGEFMYFLHSYYVVPREAGVALCLTDYEGVEYCSGAVSGNVIAFQFHPEKSARKGIDIYRSFAGLVSEADVGAS